MCKTSFQGTGRPTAVTSESWGHLGVKDSSSIKSHTPLWMQSTPWFPTLAGFLNWEKQLPGSVINNLLSTKKFNGWILSFSKNRKAKKHSSMSGYFWMNKVKMQFFCIHVGTVLTSTLNTLMGQNQNAHLSSGFLCFTYWSKFFSAFEWKPLANPVSMPVLKQASRSLHTAKLDLGPGI